LRTPAHPPDAMPSARSVVQKGSRKADAIVNPRPRKKAALSTNLRRPGATLARYCAPTSESVVQKYAVIRGKTVDRLAAVIVERCHRRVRDSATERRTADGQVAVGGLGLRLRREWTQCLSTSTTASAQRACRAQRRCRDARIDASDEAGSQGPAVWCAGMRMRAGAAGASGPDRRFGAFRDRGSGRTWLDRPSGSYGLRARWCNWPPLRLVRVCCERVVRHEASI
jgi:hypothetical protein